MKIFFLALQVVFVSLLFAGCGKGEVSLKAANARIVIAPNAPKTVVFAADEMTNFLSRVFGSPVSVVTKPEEGMVNIVLGTNKWTRAAGVDPSDLPRDSFILRAASSKRGAFVFVSGCDDPSADIRADWRAGKCGEIGATYERATIFAVYDFLERYAGCRFYFPGPLGEIVPKAASVTIPCGEVRESPAFVKRMWSLPGGALMESDESGICNVRQYGYIQMLRQRRFSCAPLIHGFRNYQLKERFGKTHPEYFALKRDDKGGTYRLNDNTRTRFNYICWSSGALDEIYADFKAYLTGQSAESRGYVGGWPKLAFGYGHVSFWPDDGFNPCECDACRKLYSSTARTGEYASELVWTKTAELARRLRAEGIPGMIEQGIYTPYGAMPKDISLPSNVVPTYCCNGPWDELNPPNRDHHVALAKKWFEKAQGTKLFLHNWACKCGEPDIPDLPSCSPRACGSFYARIAPYANGVYIESFSDRCSHMLLTTYITSKMTWNPKFDYNAAIDEHYRLMYGPAASEMKDFFDDCERLWVGKVMAGRTEMTPLGPMQVIPDRIEIWREIYTAEKLAKWAALFDRAAAKVVPGSLEARRIALMRRNVLEPVVAARQKFAEWTDAAKEESRRKREGVKNLLGKEYSASFEVPELRAGEKPNIGGTSIIVPFHFETNASYRISFFIETENVKPQSRYLFNGALVGVWSDRPQRWHFTYGNRAILGSTFGRIAQSYVLKTGPVFESKGIHVWLRGSTGKMKVDGLIVEKLE